MTADTSFFPPTSIHKTALRRPECRHHIPGKILKQIYRQHDKHQCGHIQSKNQNLLEASLNVHEQRSYKHSRFDRDDVLDMKVLDEFFRNFFRVTRAYEYEPSIEIVHHTLNILTCQKVH